jgi:hypothetical protein
LHRSILHRKVKRKLNVIVLALALALAALPRLAAASALIVGVVHDSDGYPVAGAALTLHAAGGAVAGTGRSAADGTFAIDSSQTATRIDVRCTYCVPASAAVHADAPAVFVVRRFAALRDRGISAADARVLPYDRVTSMAALMPFTVTSGDTISDRGLAGGRGTIITDGIPLYRATDGADLGAQLPAHAAATIAQTDPDQANIYDGRGSGGTFSIDTLDAAAGTARVDAGSSLDALLRGGGTDVRASLATSGGAYAASRATVDATVPAARGTFDVRAVDASAVTAAARGIAATLSAPFAGALFNATLDATRSSGPAGAENDGIAAFSVQHGGLLAGVRAQRASGMLATGTGTQADARAFIEDAYDDGTTHVVASLAAAETASAVPGSAATAGTILPIVSVSTAIARAFRVHADRIAALLPEPLYTATSLLPGNVIAHSQLSDAGFEFDDGNRLRIDAVAFREALTGADAQTTGGSGIAAVWQIAPSLALRSWTLISRTNGGSADTDYDAASTPSTIDTDRYVVWLTAGTTLRVDAISRNGKLEGDVSVPAGTRIRLVAGTRRNGPGRSYTFGLVLP